MLFGLKNFAWIRMESIRALIWDGDSACYDVKDGLEIPD